MIGEALLIDDVFARCKEIEGLKVFFDIPVPQGIRQVVSIAHYGLKWLIHEFSKVLNVLVALNLVSKWILKVGGFSGDLLNERVYCLEGKYETIFKIFKIFSREIIVFLNNESFIEARCALFKDRLPKFDYFANKKLDVVFEWLILGEHFLEFEQILKQIDGQSTLITLDGTHYSIGMQFKLLSNLEFSSILDSLHKYWGIQDGRCLQNAAMKWNRFAVKRS